MENMISIAIPAYRNAVRLERCLESIKQVDPNWLALTVVTDDSGDGQVASTLCKKYEEVTWIVHECNKGFANAANAAVLSCKTNWVLLLNDDSQLTSDPRTSLIPFCNDDKVFAISLRSTNESGVTREGAKRLVWRFGIAKILHNERDQLPLENGVSETSYAVGGHALYNRESFQHLGGFDSHFHPFYWEDVDLSERAQKKGLKVLFCYNSTVVHNEDGAIKTSNSSANIRYSTWLNRLLFSHRHANGFQRRLFSVGLLWNRIHALVTNDEPKRRAISEFIRRSNAARQ